MDEQALEGSFPAVAPFADGENSNSPDTAKSTDPTGTFEKDPPFIDKKGIPIPAEGSNQDNTPTKSRFQNIINGVSDTASSGQTGAFEPVPKDDGKSDKNLLHSVKIFTAQEHPVGRIVKIGDKNFIRTQENGDNGEPQSLWRQVLERGYGESSYSDDQIQAMFENPPKPIPESTKSETPKGGITNSPFTSMALNDKLNPAIIGGYQADQGRKIINVGEKNDAKGRNVMAASSIAGATPPNNLDPITRGQLYQP